jgi:AbrB family looped-hinge helix DNA binding protein
MSTAALTSKGQVTIPKDVRDRLGLRKGDRIEFRIGPDGTTTLVTKTLRTDDVFGILARYGRGKKVSIGDMHNLGGAFTRNMP